MTHQELVSRAARWLKTKRCGIVLTEFQCWGCQEQPDAIGWRDSGRSSVLIECKASLGDFYSDKKKPFRRVAISGLGRERYYMTPKGLLGADRVQRNAPGWGLIEVCGKVCRVKLKPIPFGHDSVWREMTLIYSHARRLADPHAQ